MERSELVDIVRRPLSPDMQVEVPVTREEYEQVEEMLENEQVGYPQLWVDGAKNVAIVVAEPSPLHSRMAMELITDFREEVKRSQEMNDAIAGGLSLDSDTTNTKRSTTRAWDSALFYTEDDDETLMIAVKVGFSQTYESLRAAISWCVCAMRCRLGIAMSIHEEKREKPLQAQDVDGQNQHCGDSHIPETLLCPTQSFVDGRFVGGDVPSNLHEIVLGDCIPSHILSGGEVGTRPVN
ncbi:hypothetical protein V1515DRAFT_617964 [Lipomyces mesembrius]